MLATHGEPVRGVPVLVLQLGLERRLPPQLAHQPVFAAGGGQVECRLAASIGEVDVELVRSSVAADVPATARFAARSAAASVVSSTVCDLRTASASSRGFSDRISTKHAATHEAAVATA